MLRWWIMPDTAINGWLLPYWGGSKWHMPVYNPRLKHHFARCNKTIELDEQRARKTTRDSTICSSCLKWSKLP